MTDWIALDGLTVKSGDRTLVHDVTLTLQRGELVGLVGASGSGKTLTCRSLLGMVDLQPGVIRGDLSVPSPGGPIRPYQGQHGASRRARDRLFAPIRGHLVGYLPQHAQASLDPLRRVRRQIRTDGAVEPWLVRAGFPEADAPRVANLYPHQLSGGMAQRVAIAQVLALGSPYLVADEPTTGLDAAVQVQLVRTLRGLADQGLGILMVTHDLGLLRDTAHRLLLMDRGQVVEHWTADRIDAGEAETAAGRRLLSAVRARSW